MTSRHLVNTLAFFATCLLVGTEVRAQGLGSGAGDSSFGAGGVPTKASPGQSTGIKLSEDTLFHLGIAAEAGYDTNVFFTKTQQSSSPLLRVTPFVELTNGTREGAAPQGVFYDLSAALQYREFLTSDALIRAQRAFNPTVSGILQFANAQRFSFQVADTFSRMEEPPFGATVGNITRDNNLASIQFRFAPGGGRIAGTLRYSNTLDIFENADLKFANSMGHEGLLDLGWKWMPKTAVFVQVAQGAISYFNSDPMNPKQSSFPLRTLLGVRGLVTEKLNLTLAAGYANGFYSGGVASPSGLGNVTGNVELGYQPGPMTAITLGYRHEFRNAVVGDFYNVDAPYLSLRQSIAGRLAMVAFAKYEHRVFSGYLLDRMVIPRTDDFVQAGVTVDYFVQQWFYAGIGYIINLNSSTADDTAMRDIAGADYTKHQVMGRLGITY